MMIKKRLTQDEMHPKCWIKIQCLEVHFYVWKIFFLDKDRTKAVRLILRKNMSKHRVARLDHMDMSVIQKTTNLPIAYLPFKRTISINKQVD